MNNDEMRLYRSFIKEHGRVKAREEYANQKPRVKLGRPKKFDVETKRKTVRFPIDLMKNIEWNQKDNENFTDSILRLVELGLRLDSFIDDNQDLFNDS